MKTQLKFNGYVSLIIYAIYSILLFCHQIFDAFWIGHADIISDRLTTSLSLSLAALFVSLLAVAAYYYINWKTVGVSTYTRVSGGDRYGLYRYVSNETAMALSIIFWSFCGVFGVWVLIDDIRIYSGLTKNLMLSRHDRLLAYEYTALYIILFDATLLSVASEYILISTALSSKFREAA